MQPIYEYRVIKEIGMGDTMPDFAMVQPLDVMTNYKVQ